MAEVDLRVFEYPRLVYRAWGDYRRVDSHEACAVALAEGYGLVCPPPPDSPQGLALAAKEQEQAESAKKKGGRHVSGYASGSRH